MNDVTALTAFNNSTPFVHDWCSDEERKKKDDNHTGLALKNSNSWGSENFTFYIKLMSLLKPTSPSCQKHLQFCKIS